MKEVLFNKRHIKGVPFLPNGVQKGKGLDLGADLPVLNFLKVPRPPGVLGQVTKLNHFQIHICFYHEKSTVMLNGDHM